VPFGIAALIAILSFVPNQRESKRRPLDITGFLLTGCTLILLLYGTEMASRQNADLALAGMLVLAGLLVGLAAIRHANAALHPLLDLTALKIPTFSVTVLSGSASRIGIEAVPYLSPLLFQLGFGLSPFHSGLLLLATATGNLGMKAFTTRILNGFGFRRIAVYNLLIAAAFIAACGWLAPSTPLLLMLAVLFIYGLSRSLQFTTLATLAYADIDDTQKGPASTLWSVAQQMTIGMGIAFGALSLRISTAFFPTALTHGGFSLNNFRWAFAMAALLALASILGYLRLPRDAGDNIRNRRK